MLVVRPVMFMKLEQDWQEEKFKASSAHHKGAHTHYSTCDAVKRLCWHNILSFHRHPQTGFGAQDLQDPRRRKDLTSVGASQVRPQPGQAEGCEAHQTPNIHSEPWTFSHREWL